MKYPPLNRYHGLHTPLLWGRRQERQHRDTDTDTDDSTRFGYILHRIVIAIHIDIDSRPVSLTASRAFVCVLGWHKTKRTCIPLAQNKNTHGTPESKLRPVPTRPVPVNDNGTRYTIQPNHKQARQAPPPPPQHMYINTNTAIL